MKLQIQALSEKIGREIPLPYYATEGAAAVDLHACIDEAVTLPPGGRALLPTGLAAAIPAGHVGLLAVRSSMGIRHGVTLSNGVGHRQRLPGAGPCGPAQPLRGALHRPAGGPGGPADGGTSGRAGD